MPRDNLIAELGLFTGRLGRDRALMIVPETDAPRLPSDLLGVTYVTWAGRADGNVRAAMREPCVRVADHARRLGSVARIDAKQLSQWERGRFAALRLNRRDFDGTYTDFLARARVSMDLVAYCYKQLHLADLCQVLRDALTARPDLTARVGIFDPEHSGGVELLAAQWQLEPRYLLRSIEEARDGLLGLRAGLNEHERKRLDLVYHRGVHGTAALLDAHHPSGRLQVELKPYRSRHSDGYGFEVEAGSEFFDTHRAAWTALLDDGRPIS